MDQLNEVPMKEPLRLKYPYKLHHVGSSTLVVAPTVGAWFVSDQEGLELFHELARGTTPNALLMQLLETRAESRSEARAQLVNLDSVLTDISLSGLLESREYHEQHPPPSLHLNLTNCCNLSCLHCIVGASPARRDTGSELSTSEVRSVLEEFSKINPKADITFSGGEPLVRKDLLEIVRFAKELSHHVSLFSNGTLLDQEMVDTLAPYIEKIQISLDGATPAGNDRVRGAGSFAKICRAIQLCKQANVRLEISITLNPENVDDISANTPKLAALLGTGCAIRVSTVFLEGRAAQTWPDLDRTRLDDAATGIVKELCKFGLDRKKPLTRKSKLINCGFGPGIKMDANGAVYPCRLIDTFKMGNVRTTPLAELYERLFEQYLATSVDTIPECRDCDLKYVCRGGCRVENYRYRGDLLKPGCTQEKRDRLLQDIVLNSGHG